MSVNNVNRVSSTTLQPQFETLSPEKMQQRLQLFQGDSLDASGGGLGGAGVAQSGLLASDPAAQSMMAEFMQLMRSASPQQQAAVIEAGNQIAQGLSGFGGGMTKGGPSGAGNVAGQVPPALESTIVQGLIIEGVVTDDDGEPAQGIVVYAYHTDAGGVYPRAATRHGRLRGWVRTDAAGRYRFDTIRPGAYPVGTVPQHVHMHVIEPGAGTYWIDSIHFRDDALLGDEARRRAARGRGGSGLVEPSRDADGAWHVRRDIVLRAGLPGD